MDCRVVSKIKQECGVSCDEPQDLTVNRKRDRFSVANKDDAVGGSGKMSHSSYSAAINVAHKASMRVKRESPAGRPDSRLEATNGRHLPGYTHEQEDQPLCLRRQPRSVFDLTSDYVKQEVPEEDQCKAYETSAPDLHSDQGCLKVQESHGNGHSSQIIECDVTFVETGSEDGKNTKSERSSRASSLDGDVSSASCGEESERGSRELRERSGVDDKEIEAEQFSCEICEKTFRCSSKLIVHRRTHTKHRPFVCGLCGAAFTQGSHLKAHDRTHSGERPYGCETCGATFRQSSHLKRHRTSHSRDKPHVCGSCGAAFSDISYLRAHLQTHTQERIYGCEWCDARFVRLSYLKTHRLRHTGERPFVCGVCGAEFIQRTNYARHMRTHEAGRSFACGVCGSRFSDPSLLKEHRRLHKGDKRYICDVCDAKFTNCSNRNRHRKRHSVRSLKAMSKCKAAAHSPGARGQKQKGVSKAST